MLNSNILLSSHKFHTVSDRMTCQAEIDSQQLLLCLHQFLFPFFSPKWFHCKCRERPNRLPDITANEKNVLWRISVNFIRFIQIRVHQQSDKLTTTPHSTCKCEPHKLTQQRSDTLTSKIYQHQWLLTNRILQKYHQHCSNNGSSWKQVHWEK